MSSRSNTAQEGGHRLCCVQAKLPEDNMAALPPAEGGNPEWLRALHLPTAHLGAALQAVQVAAAVSSPSVRAALGASPALTSVCSVAVGPQFAYLCRSVSSPARVSRETAGVVCPAEGWEGLTSEVCSVMCTKYQ